MNSPILPCKIIIICTDTRQRLAAHALRNIEDTDPPLFLRFINLLVNDAIFLLDEALDVRIVDWLIAWL